MRRVGLIAGRGSFPLLFSQEARAQGVSIVCVGVKGETNPSIKKLVDTLRWVHVWEFRKVFDIFKAEGVREIAMAGQIHPKHLFNTRVTENKDIASIFNAVKDRRADTIFGAVSTELEKDGFTVIDSTAFVKNHLPAKGVLTSREPSFNEWNDIYFGFEAAKYIAAFDIGQTVAVKHKAVVAVEALEGTDATIKRAGFIGRGGAIVVKVSKPKQDMRFDIPVVGLRTIRNLARTKASCLAFEAGKTLFLDKDVSLRLANSKGIAIVAV